MNLRENAVTVIAEIESILSQIAINQIDQSALRFL